MKQTQPSRKQGQIGHNAPLEDQSVCQRRAGGSLVHPHVFKFRCLICLVIDYFFQISYLFRFLLFSLALLARFALLTIVLISTLCCTVPGSLAHPCCCHSLICLGILSQWIVRLWVKLAHVNVCSVSTSFSFKPKCAA